ncbi:hypothetical protein [[Clostridium] colinum]|uniref:hypothetical protein n=1 Tax=[Clostridium] colinum TaxID=36835 RepID=UPI0020256D09|nr:hypothetical protein [[Clostridium] colinum]
MIEYYIDAKLGVDEENAGTTFKPFKTLDYCIEKIDKSYNDDVTVYLDKGEYLLSKKIIFTGAPSKNLYLIGKGIDTIVIFDKSLNDNYGNGTQSFNVHLYKFTITTNLDYDPTNFLGANCNLHLKNILFKDIPSVTYGFWSKFYGDLDTSTIQYCVQNNDTGLLRGTTFYNNNQSYGNYGKFQCVYECQSSFLENENNKIGIIAELDDVYNITDPTIDRSKIGLYAGEYAWTPQDCLIKMDNKYYSINEEFWNTNSKEFNPIETLNFEKSFDLSLLTKEVKYGQDTFVPLDKFNNFNIIFKDENIKKLNINGYKIESKTVITNPIDLRMVERFNFLSINGKNVKCLMKFNKQELFYKYDFEKNTIEIEELNNISTNGIDISKVKDIDFNKIKENYEDGLKSITFAFYIEINSIINNIQLNYLEIGEFIQDQYNANIRLGYKKISLTPSYATKIAKINIL